MFQSYMCMSHRIDYNIQREHSNVILILDARNHQLCQRQSKFSRNISAFPHPVLHIPTIYIRYSHISIGQVYQSDARNVPIVEIKALRKLSGPQSEYTQNPQSLKLNPNADCISCYRDMPITADFSRQNALRDFSTISRPNHIQIYTIMCSHTNIGLSLEFRLQYIAYRNQIFD